MKKIIQAAVFFFPFLSFASVHENNGLPGAGIFRYSNLLPVPHATFSKQWIDYDVFEDGVKGMRIHIMFTAYEMKDLGSYAAIYFQDDLGNKLKDKNQKFNSTSGEVAVYKLLNPCCDVTDYKDLQVFMPYDELDLEPGSYNLTMDVDVIYKEGGMIQHLNYYDFEYTKPGGLSRTTRTSSSLNATFDNMSVDYDVTENGVKGMRIHAKFTLFNMKGVDAYLAIYFATKNGEKLKTSNTSYSSKEGQVAVYKSLKPAYDQAVYSDLQVFMPYSELNLRPAKYDLTMDLDVIYQNGDLVKHLKYYDFWYESK